MIKKPDDLKKVFANGAIPTETDFSDLLDSFVPKDELSAADLQALREMIAWWRSRGTANRDSAPAGTSAASSATPAVPASAPVPAAGDEPAAPADAGSPASAAPAVGVTPSPAQTTSQLIPADGHWHALPITSKTVGTWTCSAKTVDARASYRITNNAIAVIGANLSARRLVQNVDRDSLLPWHTIQFKWLPESGSSVTLNVRARSAFGPDAKGLPTQIQCAWARKG